MHTSSYDVAVIGSSPFLLMLALQLRRGGKSVVLFESDDRLGGAWRLEDVEGIGPVECACHLIEWYRGGYEMLAELGGTPLVLSDPQPVRVFLNGRVAPYTSRGRIAYLAFRATLSLGLAFGRMLVAGRGERGIKQTRLAGAWRALLFELRFRLPGVLAYDGIRRPAEGYVGFVDTLCARVADSGIVVLPEHVDHIEPGEGYVMLQHGDHDTRVGKVVLGESARIDNFVDEKGSGIQFTAYHHIVVGLPAADAVMRSDYVHTPDDPIFHRVTYVRDHVPDGAMARAIFLVQLRKPVEEIPAMERELGILFRRCGIAAKAEDVVVYKAFSQRYMQRSLPGTPLETGPVLQGVRTIGDLARNMVTQSPTFDAALTRRGAGVEH